MKNKSKTVITSSKGFTLLELLVVIAIIAIFTTMTMAALGASRTRAADTSIKSNLANMRAQGELYYNNSKTYGADLAVVYTGKCSTIIETNLFGSTTAQGSLLSLATSVNNAVGSSGVTSCAIDSDSWAFSAKLLDNNTWCVDSAGASKYSQIAASGALCN